MAQIPEVLVALLDDDSKSSADAVRRALFELAETAIPALEGALESDSVRLRARARQLLVEIRREQGVKRLELLMARSDVRIEEGLDALDEALGFQQPSVEAKLDGWALAVRDQIGSSPETKHAAEALRIVLGQRECLLGPDDDFHHVDHVSMARTIATGRGLPLTLCVIYAATARRAGVEAGLLPFPGHVLLGLGPESDRVILDPFVGGDSESMEACLVRLCTLGAPPSPKWLTPVSDRSMLVRQVRNYGAALERHGRAREARAMRALADEASD